MIVYGILGDFLNWIKEGIVWVVNLVIASIGALISYIVGVLPAMPSLPSLPSIVTDGFAYGNYWFPVGYAITLAGIVLTLWIAWMIAAIPLRWAKALRGNQ